MSREAHVLNLCWRCNSSGLPGLVLSPWPILPDVYPIQQAIVDCLAETDSRHKSKLNTFLTLNFQNFKPAVEPVN